MSNKTQNSNHFSLLRKSGSYKNMLYFMAKVYVTRPNLDTTASLKRSLKWNISNDKLRTEIAAFRLNAHYLALERRRHINGPREIRVCRLCSMLMMWSEFYILLVYPRYNDIRREILPSTAWPSVAKS